MLQLLAAGLVAAAPGRTAGSDVRILRQEELGGRLEGLEATWLEVSFEPGASSTVHTHPGPVFGFVLEGRFRFGVQGGEERILGPGDTFFETFDAIHQTSANAGDTRVRLAVVIIAPPGSPMVRPA